MIRDGLWDSFSDVHMGSLAEYTATKAGVSRAEFGTLIRLLSELVAQLERAAPPPKSARRAAAAPARAKKQRPLPGELA